MTAWTDTRVAELTRLWLEGWSASQVACELGGVTRNAVIGKVHRLGLSGRAQPSAPARLKRLPAAPRASQPRLAVRPAAPRPPRLAAVQQSPCCDDDGPRVPLVELSPRGCRFGLGDPSSEAFGFCGVPQVRGRYCARHAAIAYQPPSPSRAKADQRLVQLLC